MGTNGPVFDHEAHYSKKSLKELMEIRTQFETAVEKNPQIKMFSEHLAYIKMKIAERIGKK